MTRGTVWAEDGQIFLRERLDHGFVASLLEPYGGYQHLVPRLLVGAASTVPLASYAVALTALCCAVVGLVGAGTFLASRGLLDHLGPRVLLGLVPGVAPLAPLEVLGNAANVHTYLLWLTPWLLLHRPLRRRGSVVVALAVGLCLLSEVQALVFVPLTLLALRDPRRRLVVGAAWLAAAAQVVTVVVSSRGSVADAGSPGPVEVGKAYLTSVVLPLWSPSIDGARPFVGHGWAVAWLAAAPVVLVVAALVLLAARRGAASALLAAAVVVGAVVPFVVSVLLNPAQGAIFEGLGATEAASLRPLRYGVGAELFLLGAGVLLADLLLGRVAWARPASRAPAPGHGTARRIAAAVLGVCVLAPTLAHLRLDETRRSRGPAWSGEVADARSSCRTQGRPRPVGAAPRRGWAVSLTCDELGAARESRSGQDLRPE